jgi:hypothetical protein
MNEEAATATDEGSAVAFLQAFPCSEFRERHEMKLTNSCAFALLP